MDYDAFDWSAWQPTEVATLMFVFDDRDRVLLIDKKQGLGKGLINGPGGRLEPGETPVQAAVRETIEEVGVHVADPVFCGLLRFHFIDGYNLMGHVFKGHRWEGKPIETEEAVPHWFAVDAIPYEQMWADDRYWFPHVLAGRIFDGRFVFDGETMLWRAVHATALSEIKKEY